MQIRDLRTEEPDLEDVFLALTVLFLGCVGLAALMRRPVAVAAFGIVVVGVVVVDVASALASLNCVSRLARCALGVRLIALAAARLPRSAFLAR